MTAKILRSAWSQDVRLKEAEWEELGKSAGGQLPPDARARLSAAMNSYRESMDVYAAGVRPGAIRKRLAQLKSAADRMAVALGKLGDGRLVNHSAAGQWLRSDMRLRRRQAPDLFQLKSAMTALASDVQRAIDGLPLDRGRGADDDPYAAALLCAAHSEYAAVAGAAKSKRSAVPFLKLVYRRAGGKIHSDDGFEKRVIRALRHDLAKSRRLKSRDGVP